MKNYLAIGNDPAWHLIIRDGKVIFNSMYREKIVMADLPDSQITASGQTYVFKTGAQDMRLTMTNQACKDTLTARLYPEQISILFKAKNWWDAATGFRDRKPLGKIPRGGRRLDATDHPAQRLPMPSQRSPEKHGSPDKSTGPMF